MAKEYVLTFYGYSGSKGQLHFDKGEDRNRLFALAAGTLSRMSKMAQPSLSAFPPVKSWYYMKILGIANDLLTVGAFSGNKVKDIHICCHGGSAMLSLAYKFEGGKRIAERAKRFSNRVSPSSERRIALEALDEEDALFSGTLSLFDAQVPSNEVRRTRTLLLKDILAPTAYIHIWGCYSGEEWADFTMPPAAPRRGEPADENHRLVQAYLQRFELRKPSPGVARDIAMALGVPVTAARLVKGQTSGGVNFWHRDAKGRVEEVSDDAAYKEPIFMWPMKRSEWVTYGPDGEARPNVRFFNRECSRDEVPGGKPPKWFTDLY